jgi:hypothetical protein
MTPNPFLDAALDYARRGLAVVPLHWPENGGCSCKNKDKCGTPGKHPRWHKADLEHGVHSATKDEHIIRRWWARWPKANVGIATGKESSLIVVDIDPRNGGDKSLKRLPGNLPITPTSRTGGKGEHYLLKHPENGCRIENDLGFAGFAGIDLKSDGGFIVALPSRHISGDDYYWKLNLDTPLAPTPNWLLELIKKESTPDRKAAPVGEVIPKGERVKTLRSLAGTMRKRGMNEPAILAALEAINQTQCETPLPDSKIKDIARSYGKYAPGQFTNETQEPPPDWRDPKAAKTPVINFVSGAELEAMDFPEPVWIIPNILGEGYIILAGRPKLGKSWLALCLAVAVSTGGCALGKGELRAAQGKVLYLALEDRLRRIKARLSQILGSSPFPESLLIAESWQRLDNGGLDDLRLFLKEHDDCRLVVIDTLAKVRPPRQKNIDPYEHDAAVGGALQALAHQYGVSILVVHHTRKSAADDPLDEVSGTTGITGVADAIMILKRGRGQVDGTLTLTGRDIEEQELALRFHGQEGLWELMGDAAECAMSRERQEIMEIVRKDGPILATQVANTSGRNIASIRKILWRMKTDGEIKMDEKNRYYVS